MTSTTNGSGHAGGGDHEQRRARTAPATNVVRHKSGKHRRWRIGQTAAVDGVAGGNEVRGGSSWGMEYDELRLPKLVNW
jgi:hypothetical protein